MRVESGAVRIKVSRESRGMRVEFRAGGSGVLGRREWSLGQNLGNVDQAGKPNAVNPLDKGNYQWD